MVSQKDLKLLVYLFEMAEKQKKVSIEELADKFQISNRTVRNNLERIDYYLKSNDLPQLKRDRKNGISLDIQAEELREKKKALLEMDTETYVFSKEERILYLKLMLFGTEDYLTYDQLSQELFVSRKTVIDDIHLVKEDCERWGIEVTGTKRGLRYRGGELQVRQFLVDGMLGIFTPLELWEILRDIYPNKSIIIEKKWHSVAGHASIQCCEDNLRACEQKGKASITDAQYYMIVVLTVLALRRKSEGKTAATESKPGKIPSYLQNYFAEMRKAQPQLFEKEEEDYLLFELDRIFNLENLEKSESMSLAMTENILLEVSQKAGKRYYDDAELRVSLQKHLISLIENSFVCYTVDEKNVRAIINENPMLYQSIYHCFSQFNEVELNVDLEAESAMLMLHFLAADERRYMRNSVNYSALIVCNNGVGTAKIVSARVKQYFPQVRIITTTAVRNAEKEINEDKPDFIISTVAFEHPNIPVIRVNTLPTEDDLKKIRIFLSGNAKFSKSLSGPNIYSRVMNAIMETCEIKDAALLEQRLSRIFPVEEQNPELLDSLSEGEIRIKLEVNDWEEAIRESARPLVEQGYVTPGYVECMVENVKKMGPYIVITKGIALPHALSTAGVNRSCISLATLKEPVRFGNKINDPVKLVICIATADKKEHMREMSKLINFISEKEVVRRVNEAEDAKDILALIQQQHGKDKR